jgi:predicted porin
MQKKIIALAIAGLVSGAAYAQTNVTVYGRVDVGYVYSKSDFRKFQGVEDGWGIGGGQSRIGFMGQENLGNGLKAIFNLEWGASADEGLGPNSPRWAYAGLTGNFGTVTAGRIRSPSDVWMGGTAWNGISGDEPINRFRQKMGIIGGDRWDNSIAYASPNFSGLDFLAVYSFGERVDSNTRDNGQRRSCARAEYDDSNTVKYRTECSKGADTSDAGKLGLGVRYANGPLYLAAVYQAQADDNSARDWDARDWEDGYGAKGWGIGGSYDFKVAKVYANYFRTKANHNGLAIGANSGNDKQTAWSLGVGVPVSSAGTVTFEYAQYKDYLNGGLRITSEDNRYLNGRTAGHKTKGYSIGYNHVLSKRTSLYTYATRFDNDRGILGGFTKTGVAGKDQTSFTVGILHTF